MLLLAAVLAAASPCVFAEPGFSLAQVEAARGGAVGLVVPDAGPTTSERRALASLERGEVSNSLRGEVPSGPRLLRADCAARTTIVGIPLGGRQPNDRRYAIVRAGAPRGLLGSSSTRIPGLVSIADVARARLEVHRHDDPLAYLRELDARIDANNRWRRPLVLSLAAVLVGAALVAPAAAVAAVPVALLGNLALGLAGLGGAWGLLLLAAPLVPLRQPRVVIWLSVAALAAYALVLALDPAAVALSPLGPSQNSRFYGFSNVLETLALPAALVAAAGALGRAGWAGFGAVAALALVTVGAGRLGADAGGVLVLAAGLGVLAALVTRRVRTAVATVAAAVAVAALAIALGPATHVTESLAAGPAGVARDLAERVELSWLRATADAPTALAVAAAVAALAVAVARGPRTPLALAAAAAVAVSLVVNDSPLEVAVLGLAGYVALARGGVAISPASRTLPRRGSPARSADP